MSTTLACFWAAIIGEFAEIYVNPQVSLPFVTAHITHLTRNKITRQEKVQKIKHFDVDGLCPGMGDSKVAPPRRPSVTGICNIRSQPCQDASATRDALQFRFAFILLCASKA
ncbi:hypothetical protein LJR267_002879 [Paraburkholderia hospita]|uniref:hypothetical protein n=1 Tax=Paraburkholderia hospita TaxID=169430 RepID=UPI003ED13978